MKFKTSKIAILAFIILVSGFNYSAWAGKEAVKKIFLDENEKAGKRTRKSKLRANSQPGDQNRRNSRHSKQDLEKDKKSLKRSRLNPSDDLNSGSVSFADLCLDVLQEIFLFTISPNTEYASIALRTLTLVNRRTNSLATDPSFLRQVIRTIPNVSFHIWMEGDYKYLTQQMLSFAYVLKKIGELESQGRPQETKDFYIKVLAGRTPTARSSLLGYRAALFYKKNRKYFNFNDEKLIRNGVSNSAHLFCSLLEQDRAQERPLDCGLDEALLQLYFINPYLCVNSKSMRSADRLSDRQGINTIPEEVPGYLLRLLVLNGLIQTDMQLIFFREAANRGDVIAQFEIARRSYLKRASDGSTSEEDTEVMKWLKKAAENGHPKAQHKLGLQMRSENPLLAAKWFTKAAEQDHRSAQYELSKVYLNDKSSFYNLDWGIYWLTRAAAQDIPEAQLELSERYMKGDGAPKNLKEAYKWLCRVPDGQPKKTQALYELAISLENDKKNPQNDETMAINLIYQAARFRHPTSLYMLAKHLEKVRSNSQNKLDIIMLYKMAADRGNVDAQYALGKHYETGEILKKNILDAEFWYIAAARQGHVEASNKLIKWYETGNEGIPQDRDLAIHWIQKIAAKNWESMDCDTLEAQQESTVWTTERKESRAIQWVPKSAQKDKKSLNYNTLETQ